MKIGRIAALALGTVLILVTAFGSAVATPDRPVAAGRADQGAYRIQVVVGKELIGEFTEISGLESEVAVEEYRNGDDPITHKRAGKAKYKNIVLKRAPGVADNAALADWYKQVLDGKTERKSGSIIYLDRTGAEVLRYNFFEAWPCRWKAPELNANSDTHIIEEIEFVVEKVERA